MKDLIKSFNLYGKITEQHAKDIEEILENYEGEVVRKVCDKMIGKVQQMEEEDFTILGYNLRIEEEKEIKQQILKELL